MRAALVAIEASAERLSTHRSLLTAESLDELTRSLAHDVRCVRLLLERRNAAVSTFDLADALEPVVASASTAGADVRCSVPGGIAVVGNLHRTGQVVLSLLHNASQHVPASPIEIRARELCGTVALYVEVRGSGVSDTSSGRVPRHSFRARI